VVFSYAFFFKGFTGLAITVGSILTLFVVMQFTGRVRWAEKFAGRPEGGADAGKDVNGEFSGKPAPLGQLLKEQKAVSSRQKAVG